MTESPASQGEDASHASYELWPLGASGQSEELLRAYSRGMKKRARGPLRRIIEIVEDLECGTVLVERDYYDADFRSENSEYWSTLHKRRPPVALRMHFFRVEIGPDQIHHLDRGDHGYLGFSVIRPSTLGPVGRTVIAVPDDLRDARLCVITDRVNVFGADLEIEGVPFCQQDGELLRCAHAAAWTCQYIAHLRGIAPRTLTADIAALPPPEMSPYRVLPSSGLRIEQMQTLFRDLGMPAILYDAKDLPEVPGQKNDEERMQAVLCKYLTSGFPIVILTEDDHAFTLVGWHQGAEGIEFIACDDQVGPYGGVTYTPDKSKWSGIMVPVPPKLFLSGEAAEMWAYSTFQIEVDEAQEGQVDPAPEATRIVEGLNEKDRPVSVRSHLVLAREYKAMLADRGLDEPAIRLLRLASLPKWVWVVEFQERSQRVDGKACVFAEVVLDSTSSDELPEINATVMQGGAFVRTHVTDPRSPGAPGEPEMCRAKTGLWKSIEQLVRPRPRAYVPEPDSPEITVTSSTAVH